MKKNKFGYTLKEEFANTLTHIMGLILSVIGSFYIIIINFIQQNEWNYIISAFIFSISLMLMYGMSSLYHSARNNKIKSLLQKLDHCSIYILIAGSYTPFTLITLYPGSGLSLFLLIWSMAALGIIIESYSFKYSFHLSMALYIIMGWFVLAFFQPLFNSFNIMGLVLLVLGGLFYTFGIIFFSINQIPYNHTIWHIFVLGGSTSHYFAVLYSMGLIQ